MYGLSCKSISVERSKSSAFSQVTSLFFLESLHILSLCFQLPPPDSGFDRSLTNRAQICHVRILSSLSEPGARVLGFLEPSGWHSPIEQNTETKVHDIPRLFRTTAKTGNT